MPTRWGLVAGASQHQADALLNLLGVSDTRENGDGPGLIETGHHLQQAVIDHRILELERQRGFHLVGEDVAELLLRRRGNGTCRTKPRKPSSTVAVLSARSPVHRRADRGAGRLVIADALLTQRLDLDVAHGGAQQRQADAGGADVQTEPPRHGRPPWRWGNRCGV